MSRSRQQLARRGGVLRRICALCGIEEETNIQALEHCFVYVDVDGTTICQCENCGVVSSEDNMADANQGGEYLEDCPVDFTFVIVTNADEGFIRSHLQIINANYVDTIQETEGLMEYELEDLGDGRWKVIVKPSYTAGETYIVKLSGDLRFEDTGGDTLTFSIKAEKKQEIKLSDRIIFIKLPENHEEKGYLVESPEDSDYIYVSYRSVEFSRMNTLSGLYVSVITATWRSFKRIQAAALPLER